MKTIEIIQCDLPERTPITDEFGNVNGRAKMKLPDGADFWPAVLIDGEPSPPEVATSTLARGKAKFGGDFAQATGVVERLCEAALDPGEWSRYRDVVTAAVKLEVRRMQEAFAASPVVEVRRGNVIHDFIAVEDVARVLGVDVETALAWAGQKYAASIEVDGVRLVERSSVARCVSGDTTIVDPLPDRPGEAPPRRGLRRLAATAA